ncbi:MAG: hypothetical protein ABSD74_14005 [Rhizomicrobium sp.]|jgi:uncharacterized membrane protein YozB (DUF420 family)
MKYDSTGFPPFHRWDRNFFLLMVGLIWLGVVMGFVPEIIRHFQLHKPGYPLVVHVHAVAFVGWLLLLSAQVLLIRTGNLAIHRQLGVAGMVLAPVMVVLGFAAAEVVDYLHFGTPQGDAPFLAIQYADLVNFATLAAAAFLLRGQPSAHKRLIILATIFISDAGWARWWGDAIEKAVGDGFWQDWLQDYLGDVLLVVLFAAYDFITRRRLNAAFVRGAAFGLTIQLIAVWLYVSPWWKPVATKLIGH